MITFKGRIGNVEYMLPRYLESRFYHYHSMREYKRMIITYINKDHVFLSAIEGRLAK